MRTANSRAYRMQRRAEQVDQTRQRIVDAAVVLHGTIGPAATTIAGIADAAGVTRLTVYRHFPDDAALFEACSSDWLSRQQPPDPATWADVTNPSQRLRTGLADLYRFYRSGADMLFHIYRDIDSIPQSRREFIRERDRQLTTLLTPPRTGSAASQRRMHAAVGHSVSFWTWWSLCHEHGLSDGDAIEIMATTIEGVASEAGFPGQPITGG
jgi:AcrR family transcriptional regulator